MPLKEKYPLDAEEQSALTKTSLASQLMLLIIGLCVAGLLHGMKTGDWVGGMAFGWVPDFLLHVRPSIWLILGPVLMIAIVAAVDFALKNNSSYQAFQQRMRSGLMGEMFRLPLPIICGLMVIAGIVEEFVFRYAMLGCFLIAFTKLVGLVPGAAIALILSSLIFWKVHSQYKDAWSGVMVFSIGMLLGLLYLYTQSWLVVAVTHAVYNIADITNERHRMMNDPDYFGGDEAPDRLLVDNKIEL